MARGETHCGDNLGFQLKESDTRGAFGKDHDLRDGGKRNDQ